MARKAAKTLILSLVAYETASVTLFLYPQLKERPGTARREIMGERKVLVAAHRCGSADALENTTPAALKALKSGADILHIDVKGTKDNVPILWHDGDLSRPCHQGRFSEDFLFKDLPPIVTQELDIPFMGEASYKVQKSDSKRINSLEELLNGLEKADPARQSWIHLEFKSGDDALVRETYRLLSQYGRHHRTIWGHPDAKMAPLLSSFEGIKRMASSGEIHKLYLLYFTGLLPFFSLSYQCIWMPVLTPGFHYVLRQQYGSSRYKRTTDGDNWKYKLRVTILELMLKTSGPLFGHLYKRGIFVMAGVPNSNEEYNQALGLGVDAILTDRPGLLKQHLS